MSSNTIDLGVISIQDWLIQRVAAYVERPPGEIDPAVHLAEYGMDSVYALGLCGDIEAMYDIEVDPTLAWDHPTVSDIAGHLAERLTSTD